MLASKEIAAKWEGTAKGKAALSPVKCLVLGCLAGMYIAFGAIGCTVTQASVEGGSGKLLGACVFPVGLILVVLAGGELFTGNCLMAGPALMGKAKWSGVLKNWLLVYLGNMLGAMIAALIAVYGHILENGNAAVLAMAIADKKCNLSFTDAIIRGIGCNILVCGAVWMASGAEKASGKALCCFFPVMLFVLAGMEHSVANMYYIPAGMLLGCQDNVNIASYLLGNLLPVTLGNILGGGGLAIAYAAVYRK